MRVRTKKRLCVAVGLLAFLTMLGIIGGCELGTISFWRGAALSALCELTAVCAWYKGGVFRHE